MAEVEAIKRRFELLAGHLDERRRRLWAASEALAIGRGGASTVARATGVSRRMIGEGIKELADGHRPGRSAFGDRAVVGNGPRTRIRRSARISSGWSSR